MAVGRGTPWASAALRRTEPGFSHFVQWYEFWYPTKILNFETGKLSFNHPSVCSQAWLGRACCCMLLISRLNPPVFHTHSCWYQIVGCCSGFSICLRRVFQLHSKAELIFRKNPFHHLQHFRTANNTSLLVPWRFMLVPSGAKRAAFHSGLLKLFLIFFFPESGSFN